MSRGGKFEVRGGALCVAVAVKFETEPHTYPWHSYDRVRGAMFPKPDHRSHPPPKRKKRYALIVPPPPFQKLALLCLGQNYH